MEKKYYKHKIQNLLVISKIITVHYFEFDKSFAAHTESHDFWELVYADKGDIICVRDGKETVLKEGEVIFHKPNAPHSLHADGKRAPNVFIVSFECKSEAIRFFEDRQMSLSKDLLRYIFAIIDESKRTFDLPFSDPELKKMRLLSSPTLGGQQLIKNFLEILLISLMRDEDEKGESGAVFLHKDGFEEQIPDKITAYMRDHINEALCVDELCRDIHYSRSYIFKQFKQFTGYTIMAYFTKLKVERAKEMLREGNISIGEVSATLSFDNPNYFSKIFKKYTGYTPSTYRKMRRNVKK
jgi:AraC-like DNA-binding protein